MKSPRLGSFAYRWREAGKLHRHRVVLLFSVMVPSVAVGSVLHFLPGSNHWSALFSGGWLIFFVAAMRLSERRIQSLIRDMGGEVCWQCWYPLRGVSPHTCPECGEPFLPAELRERWALANFGYEPERPQARDVASG